MNTYIWFGSESSHAGVVIVANSLINARQLADVELKDKDDLQIFVDEPDLVLKCSDDSMPRVLVYGQPF